jgi:hypothetical protein
MMPTLPLLVFTYLKPAGIDLASGRGITGVGAIFT